PLVSIELSEPSQVQKDVTPLTQENNVNTNCLFSELVERHPNIHLPGRLSRMPSESFDIMKSKDFNLDNLESENRSLNEEMGVLMQINELFDKESIVFQNQIKEQASNKKAEHEKIASDDDDSDFKGARVLAFLLNTTVHSPEISETNKDKLGSSQSRPRNYDDSRFFYVVNHPKNIPSWAYITSESEDEKVSETSSKRSRNSELETGESSTIGII
ncbi:44409_t:CDS:2, partial [Gigaspora margarita]